MKAGHSGERQPGISPDQLAFRRFLEWLDEGSDSGGQKYLEMHRRLVSYFDHKNCLSPRELADETLSRVARRLEEEGSITGATPAHYCYIIARFVFLEYQRQRVPLPISDGEVSAAEKPDDATETHTRRLDCLEQCLGRLEQEQRELILTYYQGEQRVKIASRRELAGRLGLTVNALSIRACRIRDRLEACVRTCSGANETDILSKFRLI
jgi:DNA-directed RNA polymerase specialized sigma24 family protein